MKEKSDRWKTEIPMWITWSRIGLTIATIGFMAPRSTSMDHIAAMLFILAAFSDYLDGYFARKFQSITVIGKFMDPVADKLLVSSVLIMMVSDRRVDPFMVIILLGRDTFIGGLRSLAASRQMIISAGNTGKWKTALQMLAIPMILLSSYQPRLLDIGYWALWFSVILSVISGIEYGLQFLRKPAER